MPMRASSSRWWRMASRARSSGARTRAARFPTPRWSARSTRWGPLPERRSSSPSNPLSTRRGRLRGWWPSCRRSAHARCSPRPSWVPESGMTQHDGLDDVRHVLAAVDRGLQLLVQLLQLDHLEDVVLLREEAPEGEAEHVVGLVLQPVDLDREPPEHLRVFHVAQPRHRLLHLDARPRQHLREELRLLRRRLHLVDEEPSGDRVDMIDDVVEPRDEGVDVLRLERRDERGIELVEGAMSDVVAGVLEILDVPDPFVEPVPALEGLLEGPGRFERLRRELIEQIEESVVPREEAERHDRLLRVSGPPKPRSACTSPPRVPRPSGA